ncbi:MAG: hypothetical protein WA982_05760 [Rubrobacteraceae bacterium]
MGARLFVAATVGIAVGVILTWQILFNDFIRIWLVNVPWLLVWGGAVVTGVVVGLLAPRGREASVPAISVLLGSVVGIIVFGIGLGFSLADEDVLTYLLSTLLISGVCLMILAALGGMFAAAIRDSQEDSANRRSRGAAYGRDSYRSSRGYREPPDRY